jgi:TRAP-type C4-dicarboxylate transport system permease small subunit
MAAVSLRNLRELPSAIAVGAMLLTAGLTTTSIVSRYAFNAPIPGDSEIVGVLGAWIAMLGLAMAFEERPAATEASSRTTQLSLAGQVAILLWLAISGVYFCVKEWSANSQTTNVDLSDYWAAVALPVGFLLSAAAVSSRLRLSGARKR